MKVPKVLVVVVVVAAMITSDPIDGMCGHSAHTHTQVAQVVVSR